MFNPGILDYVVALSIPDSDTEQPIEFVGTGFLYGYCLNKDETSDHRYFPSPPPTPHVIDGPEELLVRLNGREAPVVWRPDSWITHPDPEVDVAVAVFHLAEEPEFRAWFLNDVRIEFREALGETGFMEGDEVYVLGFPMGMAGVDRNYVIVRDGVVALT